MKRTQTPLVSTPIYKSARKILICLGYKIDVELLKVLVQYNPIDCVERYQKLKSIKGKAVTLERLCLRYGDELGSKKFQEYREKQALTNTFEYKQKKYGWNKDQFNEYNRSRSVTYENLIFRHGQDVGIKKWNDYVEKQRHSGCSLSYFQEKYGIEDGERFYQNLNKKKAHTFDNFLKRHNNDYGRAKLEFEKYKHKTACKKLFSKISQKLFWKIYNDIMIDGERNSCYFGELNKEYGVFSEPSYFFLDFYIKKYNLVVEFFGDQYHANPLYFSAEDFLTARGIRGTSVAQVWLRDKQRNSILENKGYRVEIVWETDFLKNPEQVMARIENIINEFRN